MQVILNPIRTNMLECFLAGAELSFSELMKGCRAKRNHGKFGYHLRSLMLNNMVECDPVTLTYRLAKRGVLAVEVLASSRMYYL